MSCGVMRLEGRNADGAHILFLGKQERAFVTLPPQNALDIRRSLGEYAPMSASAVRHSFVHFTQSASTLIALSELRAQHQTERTGFLFLGETEEAPEAPWTYGALAQAARRLAATLRKRLPPGERVLVLCPPGPEFLIGLFATWYAGLVAVPTYPPEPSRLERTLARTGRIAADCGARVALLSAELVPLGQMLAAQQPQLAQLAFLSTADGEEPAGGHEPRPDDVALLQYTSGSTGEPRGVAITHRNILSNLALIHEGVEQGPDSSCVLWLPPYHDMGLLNLLYALAVGFPCAVMSPAQFIQRPLRWLSAITRHRATYSGGPNFAYELCIRKIPPEQRTRLDLSSWEVAFNGAEPIRAETLARFQREFGPCGFSARAFLPCYGLAEFTVAVAGGSVHTPPVVRRFDKEELGRGRAVPAGESDGVAVELVGCGNIKSSHELRIVEPVLRAPLPAGLVGEIWVTGPSMAAGYWGRPDESAATFGVPLAETAGPGYLRTGDLGFVHRDELFVVGRSKDLIILYGRNHAPQDLERSAESAHPALRPGGTAAFSLDAAGEAEALVLCCEAEAGSQVSPDEIIAAIRQRLATDHQVEVGRVLLLPRGGLPRTASGKVQRRHMRERAMQGTHEAWASWPADSEAARPPRQDQELRAGAPAVAPPVVELGGGASAAAADVVRWIAERVQALGGAPLAAHEPLAAAGLDSLGLLELAEDLSVWLGRRVAHTFAWEHPTLQAAAHALVHVPGDPGSTVPVGAPVAQAPRTVPQADSTRFYQDFSKEQDQQRTNVHYEAPARFFEVMTGGDWQIYSCNQWSRIPGADPTRHEHQTQAQEHKLDTFAQLIGARPGMRVLEVGCAQGGALRYLAQRYGILGHGIALSSRQVEYAQRQAQELGLPLRYEVRHWEDLSPADGPFDAIISDEVIVHFYRLEQFFRRAFTWLGDDGVMVHKEVHFTHPSYGAHMDRLAVLANDIFGGTGNYRTLAEELDLTHRAGFHIESVLELPRSDYALTARSWSENLRRHESEMVELVGAERYLHFLKWVAWVQLGPGGQSQDPPIMSTHFVKARKVAAPLRRRLGIREPQLGIQGE